MKTNTKTNKKKQEAVSSTITLDKSDKAVCKKFAKDMNVSVEIVERRMFVAKRFIAANAKRIESKDEIARIMLEILYGNIIPTNDTLPLTSFIEVYVEQEKKNKGKAINMDVKAHCIYGDFNIRICRAQEGKVA